MSGRIVLVYCLPVVLTLIQTAFEGWTALSPLVPQQLFWSSFTVVCLAPHPSCGTVGSRGCCPHCFPFVSVFGWGASLCNTLHPPSTHYTHTHTHILTRSITPLHLHTHARTHTHTLAHPLTPPTHSLTHSFTHPLTHPPTHSLTH